MENRNLWELMRKAWIKLEAKYEPELNKMVSESGLTMREWMILVAVLTFEPEDATPSHLMVRGPYTSTDRYLSWLENCAHQGYLDQINPGRFRLSNKGRVEIEEFIRVARRAMVAVDRLPSEKSRTLVELFGRLVDACIETPPPPDTWSISLSKKLMPDKDPALPYIEQAMSCLSAYRDDAHLAAWQTSGLSATAMESLSLIWRDQVVSLDELTDKMSYRGHPKSVYIDAVDELNRRDYLSGTRNAFQITEEGHDFREIVEIKTDEYFFIPWDSLSEYEMKDMAELIEEMIEGISSPRN